MNASELQSWSAGEDLRADERQREGIRLEINRLQLLLEDYPENIEVIEEEIDYLKSQL